MAQSPTFHREEERPGALKKAINSMYASVYFHRGLTRNLHGIHTAALFFLFLSMHAPERNATLPAHSCTRRDALSAIIGGVGAAWMGLFSADVHAAAPKKTEEINTGILTFNGSDAHVLYPPFPFTGRTPLSIQSMVMVEDAENEQTIVGNHHGNGFALRLCKKKWEMLAHNGRRYVTATSDEDAVAGMATRIDGICDGVIMRLYVNGVLQKKMSAWSGKHKPSALPLMIGADPDSDGHPQHFLEGEVSALRISGVARDARGVPKRWMEDPFGPADRYDLLYPAMDASNPDALRNQARFALDGVLKGARWRAVSE